jgi:hypothetical protein
MQKSKGTIAETIQNRLDKRDWHGVIEEMEKMFALSGDPHIRIRIGDARRKLNRNRDAIREYIFAAHLFAEQGFLAKAAAQYSLVLRLDSSNENARLMRELVNRRMGERKQQPRTREYQAPQPI